MRSLFATRTARIALTAVAALGLATTAAATANAGTASTTAKHTTRACVTKDLVFTTNFESQAGGYILVTTKARPGVTCHLDGVFPSASFGSSPDTAVSPAEQAVSEGVTLSGAKAAYAGINPKTTNNNNGIEFGELSLSVAGDEAHSTSLTLQDSVLVDQPIATNWHAKAADAVPFAN
ncbi:MULTISPECIES: DUF4232 domain-containing protein [unclassified Streptomyces]|uniref:DUF4232 domain-containing protein n=1 Tax=unclassified Streptomyces TaxID=2593676 RepID=UPI0004BFC769|nr:MULTISPECIES: DUF4232 domain-containing protein [unclassified Streptomyces]